MAGAAIMNIIGVVSGVAGIIQFGMDNFPAADSKGSTLRFAVGLDSDGGLTNAGGHIPGVALFNEGGTFLGQGQGNGKVGDGETTEIKVDQSNGQQAPYALFQAGNDAVCLAYISITWPDSNEYAWTGDWGAACGGTWYYSNIFIKGSDYKPKCMWIDANGDQPTTGFQVHFPEFFSNDNNVPAGKDLNYFCNNKVPFQMFTGSTPNSITYNKLDGSGTAQASIPANGKRTVTRRTTPLGRRQSGSARLVKATAADHSAQTICDSKTSSGPDLVNTTEKKFCRMSDKKVFPVCDTTTKDNCFNSVSNQLIVGGKATRETYSAVVDWTTAGTTKTTPIKARYDSVMEWDTPAATKAA